MGKRRKSHSDQRADLRGGGFLGLPGVVHRSGAYRSLPTYERAVLTEIIGAFNGYNNGEIVVSQRQISEALGNQNFGKIGKAIAVLIERGLIGIATESVWKQRLARQYRLTFISTGHPPFIKSATNEYLHWKKNDAETASAGKAQSAETASASPNTAAETVSAEDAENPQKCVNGQNVPAETASSLIVLPYQGASKVRPIIPLNARRPV